MIPNDAAALDVQLALSQHASGMSSVLYQALLQRLAHGQNLEELVVILSSIAQHGALVTQHHSRFEALLGVLFMFDWHVPEPRVCAAFEDVLASFASSHAGFHEPAFELLVGNFTRLPADAGMRAFKLQRLHAAMLRLLRLNPLACAALLPVLVGRFPSVHADEAALQGYLHEALAVCAYAPILRDKVLFVAVDRLVELDGQVAAVADADMFKMDDVAKRARTSQDTSSQDASQQDSEAVAKADALLCELMAHCAKCSRALFRQLLGVFDKLILRTGRARTAQFLVFYAARQKPSSHCDALIQLLLQRITERHEPAHVRKQAAAMLGSFLARARFVPASSAKSALHHCTAWLADESRRLRGRRESRDVFDACFQAVVYALLYKHALVGGMDFMRGLGWDGVVAGPLCPLERLSQDVAHMYAEVFLRGGGGAQGDQDEEPLRHFTPPPASAQELAETFPFDPLLLPRARALVADDYQEWDDAAVYGPDQLDEDEEEDVEGDNDDDDDAALLAGEGLPAPVRIAAIRRLLGVASMDDDDDLVFPSPALRPAAAAAAELKQLSNGLAGSW